MTITEERIVKACVDIVSAIDEKGVTRLDALLPVSCMTGRLARLLNATRTDAKPKVLSRRLLERFAQRSGINVAAIDDMTLFLEKLGAGRVVEDGKFHTEIADVAAVYGICASYWRRKLKDKEDGEDWLVVNVLDAAAVPSSAASLSSLFGSKPIVDSTLQTLLELGLVMWSRKLSVYFSPKYFGREDETVAAFLDRTKSAPREFIDLLERVHDCPGFPFEEVPPNQKVNVDVAVALGVLESIGIVVGGPLSVYLFSPEPVEDRIYLSKETTAHFRYNERYADPKKGRLNDPVKFLEVLIANGSAGAADNIATNYLALEEKGVVVARKGGVTGRPMMVARKLDVLKDTMALVENPQPLPKGPAYGSLADWIKNPIETRVGRPTPRVIDEHVRMDLVRMLRDEVR